MKTETLPTPPSLIDPNAWLCHYTTADTAFSKILPSGRLLMNPYKKMRDPFENRRPTFRGAGFGAGAEMEARFSTVEEKIAKVRDAKALVSFTRGVETQATGTEVFLAAPWARPRMWEQYADQHAGVCLVFERKPLLAALLGDLARSGRHWHGDVSYTPGGFATSGAASLNLNDFSGDTLVCRA